MPWMETAPMEQRERFIADSWACHFTMTELCRRYGISRKTGYKWLHRHAEEGRSGLQDRSHAPHSCPHRMTPEIGELILAGRRRHPDWGPRKLLDWLAPRHPDISAWPAISTAGDLLAREGLVKKRRRRPRQHPGTVPLTTERPNDLWTADFKGQFPTKDGVWCFPLTISDQHSRYLLTCRALPDTKTLHARPVFERAFREFGLPDAIRTDNGVPFTSRALHGLCRLNVWWMRLGILHQRIRPASPQKNGAHERMHRTLKAATCRPPAANHVAQQRTFHRFRRLYNDERPHDAHNGKTPGSKYRPSPKPYPDKLPPIQYPGHFVVKHVTRAGTIRLGHKLIFIAQALKHLDVGLEEIGDGIWTIHFNTVLLATVDERDMIVRE